MIKRIAWTGLMLLSVHAAADTPASFMARYAQEAGVAVTALSPARGETLYRSEHPGKRGAVQSCASCHTASPKQAGQTRVGKRIEPLAPSANPQRFTDAAKVEKWFRRNCTDVLARECTPQEKGDFIARLQQLK
jgi:mono/diheme cytochrome c family protein